MAERGGETACFGNQIFMGSWPDPYHYQVLTLFFLTEAASYDHVLLAGQGPGGFIHELLAHDLRTLVYVALDPAETSMMMNHLNPTMSRDFEDSRLTIVHDDPRQYLARDSNRRFDLIIINAPDPDNARINRLYTLEFFQAARKRLTPRGILVTSISGAENYWSRELLSYGLCLYRTIRTVFPEVIITPGDRHYIFAAAGSGLLTDNPGILAERYRRRGFQSPYLTPRSFPLFFPPTGSQYLKARLAEQNASPGRLNTDSTPLSYFLHLVWWEEMTGRPWTRAIIQTALQVETWGPYVLALFCLPSLLLLIRPRQARVSAWTMMMTGGVTMALQILLIYLFQNKHGVVYQQIGLLSALYMGGLAMGGLIGVRIIRWPRFSRALPPLLELLLAILAALVVGMAQGWLSDLILPLVAATGLISGLEFSLLFFLYLQDRSRPRATQALARLESADHGGALVGALATGLVLAPIIGLAVSAAILAGLKLLNGLVLLRPMDT